MFFSFFLIAVLALSEAVTKIPVTENSVLYECSLSYVFENMVINDDFRKAYSTVDEYDDDTCNAVLDKFRDSKYEYIEQLYNEDIYYREHTTCIIEKLREYAVADLYVLKLVYKHADQLAGIRLEKARWEVLAPIEDKLEQAEALCLRHKMFSHFFDSLYGDQNETEVEEKTDEELEADLCITCHLVENDLHGIGKYDIDVNCENIDRNDCAAHWIEYKFSRVSSLEHTFQIAPKSTTLQQDACYHKTIKSSGYPEMIFMAGILGKIKPELEKEKKNEERKHFAEFIDHLYFHVLTCNNVEN